MSAHTEPGASNRKIKPDLFRGQEMIYLPAILPFFKIHVNQVLARDDSPAANIISMHVVGEGPGAIP